MIIKFVEVYRSAEVNHFLYVCFLSIRPIRFLPRQFVCIYMFIYKTKKYTRSRVYFILLLLLLLSLLFLSFDARYLMPTPLNRSKNFLARAQNDFHSHANMFISNFNQCSITFHGIFTAAAVAATGGRTGGRARARTHTHIDVRERLDL